MPAAIQKQFPHRRNRDGSFDSICPRCFHTVATRKEESELAKDEHRHICDDWNLDQDRIAEARSRWLIRT
jgi:hypothetical protein